MTASLAGIRREAAHCTRCPLYANATQTVFGGGQAARPHVRRRAARRSGGSRRQAFVGPAGRLLRELLGEAGIDEKGVYVTNAVKHFEWRPRGTRRIHDKPNWTEIKACGHWLSLELAVVRPTLVVCLGATAAQALFGRSARVGQLRGERLEVPEGPAAIVTIHPSAVLRADDEPEVRRAELLEDLEWARKLASQSTKVAKS